MQLEEMSPWYHAVQVTDNYRTPGTIDPTIRTSPMLEDFGDVSGKSVLDVGCNAGGLCIEFARRGARVTGIEPNDHYLNQARSLREVLGLDIDYREGSVYDVGAIGQFDIVIFVGLIYHLRHPFLALDMIRSATELRAYIGARVIDGTERTVTLAMDHDRVDLDEWFPGSNWWMPTRAAMSKMMTVYGFSEVVQLQTPGDPRGITFAGTPDPTVKDLTGFDLTAFVRP